MRYFSLISLSTAATVDVIVPVDYDELYCPSINARWENSESGHPVSLSFETASIQSPVTVSGMSLCIFDVEGDCAIRLNGAENHASQPEEDYYRGQSLSAGIGSEFFNRTRSFMLIPSFDPEISPGSLVLSPQVPNQYCADGYIGYTNYTDDGNGKFNVMMSVSVIDDPNVAPQYRDGIPREVPESAPSFHSYSIDTSYSGIRVGHETMNQIVQGIFRNSFVILERQRGFYGMREGCTDEVIDSLPNISFTMGDLDQASARIVLEPRDYIVRDMASSGCRLNIYFTPDESHRYIGQTVLRHAAVYFDGVNERIGFCEPL